jgi:SAM-dependent methyltransferase
MARAEEAAEWDRAGITAGARIVDIGCGPGLIAIELAQIAGPGGRVVAVDREADAVDTARALLHERGLDYVDVHVADAWSTGCDEASFDVVNLRHVLAHNTAPDQARILEHARTLLAPGGTVFIVDSDMTGMRIDPPDADLTDLNDRYAAYLASVGRDPLCGTTLGSLVVANGFDLVERGATFFMLGPETAAIRLPGWAARDAMIASHHATAADIDRWDAALTRFAENGEAGNYARFVPRYWAIGRKPQ